MQHLPGSGLGLALVQRIADGHGGRLVLARGAAGGTRAEVRLPQAPGPASGV